MSDEAVGLIVDNCLSLRVLKLFGCTQVYPFLESSPGEGSKFFDYEQFSNHSHDCSEIFKTPHCRILG